MRPSHKARSASILGASGAILYLVGGALLLTLPFGVYTASGAPAATADSGPNIDDSQVVVTLRIHGSARAVDVVCTPRRGIAAGVVDVTPDTVVGEFHALCSDDPPAQFYER
jgi:hypothetical protein